MVKTTTTTDDISFGEYFDTQYNNLRKMMDNKDAQLHSEWLENYNKKQHEKLQLRKRHGKKTS